jgi:hypothetical protein
MAAFDFNFLAINWPQSAAAGTHAIKSIGKVITELIVKHVTFLLDKKSLQLMFWNNVQLDVLSQYNTEKQVTEHKRCLTVLTHCSLLRNYPASCKIQAENTSLNVHVHIF